VEADPLRDRGRGVRAVQRGLHTQLPLELPRAHLVVDLGTPQALGHEYVLCMVAAPATQGKVKEHSPAQPSTAQAHRRAGTHAEGQRGRGAEGQWSRRRGVPVLYLIALGLHVGVEDLLVSSSTRRAPALSERDTRPRPPQGPPRGQRVQVALQQHQLVLRGTKYRQRHNSGPPLFVSFVPFCAQCLSAAAQPSKCFCACNLGS